MYELGKAQNVVQEMMRLNMKIMGISESRWIESGQSTVENKTIYFSDSNATSHQHGVAINIDYIVIQSVEKFVSLSIRVMLQQLEAYCGTLNLI